MTIETSTQTLVEEEFIIIPSILPALGAAPAL